MQRFDAQVHVTHANLKNKLLKSLDAVNFCLSQDQIAYLRQVQVKVFMGLAIQLVY